MKRIFCGLVFALPLAFLACGSDDSDDGGGNAGTSGTGGSGGSAGGVADPRCEMSHCPMEFEPYDTQRLCDTILESPCYAEHEAYRECVLENETCAANGEQDVDSISACDPLSAAIFTCVDQQGG